MADRTDVSGKVTVESDSAERVAFELMKLIDFHGGKDAERKTEEYWLALYNRCWKAAHGQAPRT